MREIASRVRLSTEKDEISRENASLRREIVPLLPLTNKYDCDGNADAAMMQGVASRVQWKLQHVIGVLRHVHGALCRSTSPTYGDVGVIWHRAHHAIIGALLGASCLKCDVLHQADSGPEISLLYHYVHS
jgi:hypothetical protein